MRVPVSVIDVNLLVSAMISRPGSTPRKLLAEVRAGRLKLVLSRPLIAEFLEVMSRPKFARYGHDWSDVLDFVDGLLEIASFVEITGEPRGCQDPDDDAVIETAEIGTVDYLITGDSDLQADHVRASLGKIGIEVITARSFLLDKLSSPASRALFVDRARMIVAAEVGSAILLASRQAETVNGLIDSIMDNWQSGLYFLMILAANSKQRIELAKLANCNESVIDAAVSRRAVFEAQVANMAECLKEMTDIKAAINERADARR